MQRWGMSRHLCINTYIVAYLLIILENGVCCILYFILFHNVHKYFKHYYDHGNYLVFKYVFNDVGIGLLVLEHKIHQQHLCTLSKKVVI